MYILGINAYHGGASACLIKDGQLVAAVEEERFNRIKYAAGFPVQAIRWVLEEAGIGPQDLDHIGISRRPSANLMKKALYAFRRPSLQFIYRFFILFSFLNGREGWIFHFLQAFWYRLLVDIHLNEMLAEQTQQQDGGLADD